MREKIDTKSRDAEDLRLWQAWKAEPNNDNFARLLKAFQRQTHGLARRHFPAWQPADLDEAYAIVDASLLRAAAKYDPGRGAAVRTFVILVANSDLKALRQRHSLGAIKIPCTRREKPEFARLRYAKALQEDQSYKGSTPESGLASDVRSAIDQLPDHERDVIKLRYLQGLTQVDAGARLGLHRWQVREIERSAREKLSKCLQNYAA